MLRHKEKLINKKEREREEERLHPKAKVDGLNSDDTSISVGTPADRKFDNAAPFARHRCRRCTFTGFALTCTLLLLAVEAVVGLRNLMWLVLYGIVAYPEAAAHCSPSRCMDPCSGDKPTVYLYPDSMLEESERRSDFTIFRAWMKTYQVNDPALACLFIPPVNTLCGGNRCRPPPLVMDHRLRSLPHWNGGRNHVLFDLSDEDRTPFSPSLAVVVRSNFLRWNYRYGFDVSAVLPSKINNMDLQYDPRKTPPRRNLTKAIWSRKWKLAFKGRCTHPLRLVLSRMFHNPSAGRVVLVDRGDSPWCNHVPALSGDQALFEQFSNPEFDDDQLLVNATFGLVLPGNGEHSMRMVEVMQAGAVPVIVYEDLVLPFTDLLNWNDIAVLVRFSEIDTIPQRLEDIDQKRLVRMQKLGQDAYYSYFYCVQAIFDTALLQVWAQVPKRNNWTQFVLHKPS